MRGPLAMTVAGAPFPLVLKDKASSSQVRDWETLLVYLLPSSHPPSLSFHLPLSLLPFFFPSLLSFPSSLSGILFIIYQGRDERELRTLAGSPCCVDSGESGLC